MRAQVPRGDSRPLAAVLVLGVAAVAALVWLLRWATSLPAVGAGPVVPPDVESAPERLADLGGGPRRAAATAETEAEAEEPGEAAAANAPSDEPASAPAGEPTPCVLVDERTEEPVPHFELDLRGGGRQIETDERGEFVLPPIGEGPVTVVLVDVEGTHRSRRWPRLPDQLVRAGRRTKFPIPLGPTYRLLFDWPEGRSASEFHLTLDSWNPVLARGTSSPRAPLRTDPSFPGWEEPWVRFGDLPPHGAGPWKLEMRSDDGLLLARATVDDIVGIVPEPVRLEFLSGASVVGTVVDGPGEPVPMQRILLWPHDGANWGDAPHRGGTDADGRFEFSGLDPGQYALDMSLGERSVNKSFRLDPGERLEVVLTTSWPGAGGAIRGRLTSLSGTYDRGVGISMTTRNLFQREEGYSMQTFPEWVPVEGGRLEAPFAFEDVPPGEYVLRVWAPENEDWQPRFVYATPPQEGIELVAQDASETPAVRVTPLDGAGRTLPAIWSRVEYGAPGARTRVERMGPVPPATPVGSLPASGEVMRWIVGSRGFVPARGDQTAFVPPDVPGEPWTATVHLNAGWGMEIRAVEPAPGEHPLPLSGVEVLLDGESAGRTDADGRIWLEAETEPRSIRLQKPGWEVERGIVDVRSGRLRSFDVFGTVVMRRR